MKFKITKDGTTHRGKAKKAGDIVEEVDRNHIGSLQCAGAVIASEADIAKAKPAPKKKAAPKPEE